MSHNNLQTLLQNCNFYHGDITRDEAERRLRRCPADHNYYLLRPKSQQQLEVPGQLYVLSVKVIDSILRHYVIVWFKSDMAQQMAPETANQITLDGFYLEKSPGNYELLGTPNQIQQKLAQGQIELELSQVDGRPRRVALECRPLARPEIDGPLITPEPIQNAIVMPQPAPRNPKGWLQAKKDKKLSLFGNSFERGYYVVTTDRKTQNPDRKPMTYFKKFPIDPGLANIDPIESLAISDFLSVDRGSSSNEFIVRIAGKATRIFQVEGQTDENFLSRDKWVELLKAKMQQAQES